MGSSDLPVKDVIDSLTLKQKNKLYLVIGHLAELFETLNKDQSLAVEFLVHEAATEFNKKAKS